jgi:hypothetical protein
MIAEENVKPLSNKEKLEIIDSAIQEAEDEIEKIYGRMAGRIGADRAMRALDLHHDVVSHRTLLDELHRERGRVVKAAAESEAPPRDPMQLETEEDIKLWLAEFQVSTFDQQMATVGAVAEVLGKCSADVEHLVAMGHKDNVLQGYVGARLSEALTYIQFITPTLRKAISKAEVKS